MLKQHCVLISIVNLIGIVLSLYDTFLDHLVATASYVYNKDKYVYPIENMYIIRLGIGMYAISGQNYQCYIFDGAKEGVGVVLFENSNVVMVLNLN